MNREQNKNNNNFPIFLISLACILLLIGATFTSIKSLMFKIGAALDIIGIILLIKNYVKSPK